MKGLRRLIIPSRLQATVPDWIEAVRALVEQYGGASASLAADYYEAQRIAAQVTGSFTVPLADPPPDEQVDNSLRWATKDLWPRNPEDPATTEAQRAPLERRLEAAEAKAEAVAQKLVIDQGRSTVQGAVRRDRQAVAWARSAALGACAFCRLLAIRGAVYSKDTVEFRAHDGCHCMAIPVFKGQSFELSSHAKEWEEIYREFAAPHSGAQLRRFRAALAERDAAQGR
ncbi:hypothetical protein [Streptomyces ehimensis]|uniref:MuF-like minor capsid protein n=1 Tax=Streptomyces ehimensis TaxID=68195 RepID=A0ABV9BEU0_9ACTN